MEKLVELSDQEAKIDFTRATKCRANLRLKSLSATTPIAFKIQTSSPHKFLVNPPTGLIAPLSSATFQIILKPQSQIPSVFPRSPSDRFLVRTAIVGPDSPDSTHPDSINSWFASRPSGSTYDLKVKVAFVGPFLLRHAVASGDCDTVRSIIKRQKSIVAKFSTRDAESLLRVAAECNNADEMVSLLVESGLKKNDSRGSEIYTAVVDDQTDEVESMINMGECGPLDWRDKEGRTALHLAASRGNTKCMRLLVEGGADKDARSLDGRTALFRAAANGNRPMVELLMDLGADPMIGALDRGRLPCDVARDKGHKEIVELLERGELVLNAARRGESKLLKSLLQRGATVNHRDQYGLTALHAAAIKGHKEVVTILIEFGSDLESQDTEGHVPLHLAVVGGSVDTVEVLINKGANVNATTWRGATPLYMARAMSHGDIYELLLQRGATSSLPSHTLSLSNVVEDLKT